MAIINKGMSRRSFLGLTGSVAAVAGLGLTGCGGSSNDEGSASGSADSANRGGGVITAGSAYAPSSFDPASTGSAVGLGANWHVVEGLYGIDYHDYSTFNELATDDPKSVDDTTFEVTIRKAPSSPMAPRSPLTMSLPPTPLAPLPLPMLRSSSPSSPSRPRTPAP